MTSALRLVQGHASTISIVFVIAAVVGGYTILQDEAEQRSVALCRTVNDQHAVLSDLLDVVLVEGDGEGFALTQLESFPRLPPAVQDAFREIEEASRQDNPNSLDDRLRRFAADRLTPAECGR